MKNNTSAKKPKEIIPIRPDEVAPFIAGLRLLVPLIVLRWFKVWCESDV